MEKVDEEEVSAKDKKKKTRKKKKKVGKRTGWINVQANEQGMKKLDVGLG